MSDETGLIKRPSDPGVTAYTIRATAQTDPDNLMAKNGQFRQFAVRCDEPGMGGDSAPSPMGYAALSIGFWLLTQVARWAHTRKVDITDASVAIEIDISLSGSGLKGDAKADVHGVRIDFDVTSPAARADIDEVLRIARNTCFMETLITKPVPLTSTMRVNGNL